MAGTSGQRLRELVEENRDSIEVLVRRHRGTSISLFGSVARGAETDTSDADFLVAFEPGSSLFDLLHLKDDLADLLGCEVDVVSLGGLKSRDERIRQEAINL
jgi:predicted nucleotidyltransferase